MHRLLVPTEELENDCPVLPKEARDHLKVLRPKTGEKVELFDGKGRWRVYAYGCGPRIASAGDATARSAPALGSDGSSVCLSPPPPPLVLFACVTKGARWDWTIEKATELGVTRIVPVISARTVVRIGADGREAKRLRWMRIAEEAARQSDAKWIPEILAPVTFAESLALVRGTRCFVGALTAPPPAMIGTALAGGPDGREADLSPALYVGPEGDFAPEELSRLVGIATPVSFGVTILRAETAAIYGLSAIKSHLDSSASRVSAR